MQLLQVITLKTVVHRTTYKIIATDNNQKAHRNLYKKNN